MARDGLEVTSERTRHRSKITDLLWFAVLDKFSCMHAILLVLSLVHLLI